MKAITLQNNKSKEELEIRKSIWEALSLLYLDAELQDYDYTYIARKLSKSNKSIEELKAINTYEVYPALKYNLFSVAGVWQGFNIDWLNEQCTKNYYRRNKVFFRIKTKISLFFMCSNVLHTNTRNDKALPIETTNHD